MAFKINVKPQKFPLNSSTCFSDGKSNDKVNQSLTAPAINYLIPEMAVVCRPIDSIKAPGKKLRKNEQQQVKRLVKSVKEFGQVMPVLIDENGNIIDGVLLMEALRTQGATNVNSCMVNHLSEDQVRLLRIALNTIQTKAEWDIEALGAELIELDLIGLDLSLTGFEIAELDKLLIFPNEAPDDMIPDPPDEPITKPGDLWQLGPHRLYCGDALDKSTYAAVLGGAAIQVVFTDPPYNLPIKNNVSGLGKVKHDDFLMGVGEMSDAEFQEFLATPLSHCADHCDLGTVFYVCMDWRQIHVLRLAAQQSALNHINTCVWDKGNGGMGALYRSQHEFVAVFCNDKSPAINNVQLGKFGRNRTNIWHYPGANSPGSSANEALHQHATPKPIELVENALLDVSAPGSHVLDPFLGSGTTILAAERTHRIAFGIELEPKFVDVAIARWEKMTGKKAQLIACAIGSVGKENGK